MAAVIAEGKLEACEIKKPALLRQSPWEWAVSDSQGKQHIIPKAYPGFTPIPGEAERAQSAPPIRWELENILEGDFSAIYSGAITELRDIQAERENRWSWTVSYETDSGARKKLKIPRGYPDLVPVMGMERAEGPTPYRWLPGLAALALTAVFLGGGFAVDGWRMSRSGVEAVPEEPALPEVPVRVPETVTEYELSEILFRMDAAFQHSQRRFVDSGTGTFYRAYTQYGVDRDGAVCHTAAALSGTGALLTLEAEHREADQSPEEVLANLMYTLQSVRFQEPEVTEENYQSQIHISGVRNCACMAAAYLKTDLFGYDAFVDVYVPYSDTPIYAAGGRAVRRPTDCGSTPPLCRKRTPGRWWRRESGSWRPQGWSTRRAWTRNICRF